MKSQAVYLTGAGGYIGSLVESWLIEERFPFKRCSSSPSKKEEFPFTLLRLFESKIPPGSFIVHCAYDFSLKAEKDNLNVDSIYRLVKYCKENQLFLILISSGSAEFPDRSNYAQTKYLQEHILKMENFGTVLRIGILLDETNNFLNLIRLEQYSPIKLELKRDLPLFYTTDLDSLKKTLLSSLMLRDDSFKLVRCYRDSDSAKSYENLQMMFGRNQNTHAKLYIKGDFFFLVLGLLRRIRRINRLFHSLTFLR